MWKKELARIFRDRKLWIVLTVIACIPLLYAAVFLGSIWDPYGKLDRLKVAVVNQDQTATFQSQNIAVGETLVAQLKENKILDFDIVSEQKADQGIDDGTYYMKITIPKTFSKQATTLFDEQPQKMQLAYETNPGRNMVVGTISESATKSLQESIREEVTKTYTKALFEQFQTVGDGLVTASEGAEKLATGSEQLASGSETLANHLTELSQSTLTFNDGAVTYQQGISAYTSGVARLDQGAQQVATGTQTLASHVPRLQTGADQLASGADTVASGISQYTRGVTQLDQGLSKANQASPQLIEATNRLTAGLKELATQTQALPEAMNQLQTGTATLSTTVDTQLVPLITQLEAQATTGTNQVSVREVAATLTSLQEAMTSALAQLDTTQATTLATQLGDFEQKSAAEQHDLLAQTTNYLMQLPAVKAQIETLTQRIATVQEELTQVSALSQSMELATLKQGMEQLNTSLATLSDNTTQVAQTTPAMTQGMATLAAGSQQLLDGVTTYTQGIATVANGATTVDANSQALVDGSHTLANGTTQFAQQLPTLADGLTRLENGSQQVATGSAALVSQESKLTQGATQLADGATKIATGSQQLAQGGTQLVTGTQTLQIGAQTLGQGLAANGQQIVTQAAVSNATVEMFATPVALVKTEHSQVKNYGSGLAPYFLSVALFVGALAFNVIYPMNKAVRRPQKTREVFASKWILMVLFALSQAVILATVMLFGMKIQHQTILGFYLIAIMSSLASTSLVTFLNVAFGTVGKGLSMIMLVLQLGSAGGTFPLDVSNSFYQFLHPLFPITYSVMGLRQAISGGMQAHALAQAIGILIMYIVLFSGLLYVTFYRKFKKDRLEII